MIEVREATYRDALGVAENLRPADEREVRTATGTPPVAALLRSMLVSEEKWAVLHNGTPCALFGVVPNRKIGPGVAWMLCTPEVSEDVRGVLQVMDGWAARMADQYNGIQALAMADNYLHVRWAKLIGFVELGRQPLNGAEFIHIYRPPNNDKET